MNRRNLKLFQNLLVATISFLGIIVSGQIKSIINLHPKHEYLTENDDGHLFIIDKTNHTYYTKCESASTCQRSRITSKGSFILKNDTIILKTKMPDQNYLHFDYLNVEPSKYDYITAISADLENDNNIRIFFSKDNFSSSSAPEIRLFIDENNKLTEITDFKIETYKKYYFITLDFDKFNNKSLILNYRETDYPLDFQVIKEKNFVYDLTDWVFQHYEIRTNEKYKIIGNTIEYLPISRWR